MSKPRQFRPPRRRPAYALLHRLALLLTLVIGAGALVYNAVSIVNGDGGLAKLLDAVNTESAVSSHHG